MGTQNPVFNTKTLQKLAVENVGSDRQGMTLNGSINKTSILLLLMIGTGIIGWNLADTELSVPLTLLSIVINLVLCLVLVRKKHLAPRLSVAYALIEGLAIGAISAWAEQGAPGVALNAMILTSACVALMVGLYHFRIVKVTARFKSVIITAMLAICATYLVDLGMMFFGQQIPMIHESGIMGIGFSLIVVGVAALSLLIDFDMMEQAVAQKAPKYMEWYAGFAVLVTIVWLYLEVLRLLGKLSRR